MNSESSISVVIPSYNSKSTISQCLSSVLNQSYAGIIEVIVVDSSDDGTDDVIRHSFPQVNLIHIEKKTLPGAARNIGVRAADSDYIAFTDADCIPDYYWIENMVCSLQNDTYVLGGAVINGTPNSLSGTLGYLNEFSFYLPGGKTGFVDGLATANVCYKKRVFDNHQFMEAHFAGEDTIFHWSIMDTGKKLFFDPTVKVTHMNRTGFMNVLKHQRKMGVGAGLARIIMKRDLLLVNYPIFSLLVLPWIRILRMYKRVLFCDKNIWKKVILFSPISLIIAYGWSLGFYQSIIRYREKRGSFAP